MPVPIRNLSPPPERLMPRQLQGLVDTCLDEGHYLAAFSTLDHVRSQRYRPSQRHLQQLLYVALYPPAERLPPSKRRRLSPPPASPSKSREPIPVPTREDTAAAVKLLHSFRATNSAAACALALPVLAERRSRDEVSNEEDEDSRFARSATCIGRARSAWEVLKPGAAKRLGEEDVARVGDEDEEEGVLVADHAVPVLEWMVALWESDAAIHPDHCSATLLSQLPPPSTTNTPIMAAHAPLNLIAYLLSPLPAERTDGEPWRPSRDVESTRRANLASRLLSLLVACTLPSPSPLSSTSLLRQTSYTLADIPPSALQHLLTTLRPLHPSQSLAYSRFNLALGALYLAHESKNASSEGLLGASPAKKAAVPARRRPRALGRADDASMSSEAAPSPDSVHEAGERVYPVGPPKTILPMFALEPKTGASQTSSRASTPPPRTSSIASSAREQRHRITKLCMLRALLELDVRKQPAWSEAIADGDVRGAVEEWTMDDLTWDLVARMLDTIEERARA